MSCGVKKTMKSKEPRILSIQSHVVSGYVGNKSAVFPMQLLGFDVDNINSVQFSNHTGYPNVKGHVITEQELQDLMTGLKSNNLDNYTHLLTGYIGSPGFLKEIASLYNDLKTVNSDLIYVCDPVMGDNGSMYVPRELVPIYKELILPIATIITPNLFELQLLTDVTIVTEENVWEAVNKVHSKGTETICVSSVELPACQDSICIFASSVKGYPIKLKMRIPKLTAVFTGSGDLFAALMLSFLYKTQWNLKESLEKTIAALQSVLKRTFDYANGKEQTPKNMELRLIQSRDDIVDPKIVYEANVVD